MRGRGAQRGRERRAGHEVATEADVCAARARYLAAGRAAADSDQEGLAAAGLLVTLQGLLTVPGHGSSRGAATRLERGGLLPGAAARLPLPAAAAAAASTSRARVSVMPLLQSGRRRAAIRPGQGCEAEAQRAPRPPPEAEV